jgi:hypothetical protein
MSEATNTLAPAPSTCHRSSTDMTNEEYLNAMKTLYMPPYSRTTARELGVKVKDAEAYANGAPIPEPVAMRVRMKLAIYYRWKALWDARKAVKEGLRAKGIKLSSFTAADPGGLAWPSRAIAPGRDCGSDKRGDLQQDQEQITG